MQIRIVCVFVCVCVCVCERERERERKRDCVSLVRPTENRYRKLHSYSGDSKVNLNYFIAAYTKSFQTQVGLHFKVLNSVVKNKESTVRYVIILSLYTITADSPSEYSNTMWVI